jgi:hypothetical protein
MNPASTPQPVILSEAKNLSPVASPYDSLTIDDLFRVWKAARPDYTQFSDDGVLRDEVWATQRPKIAFILKEPNDDFYKIRGCDYDPKCGNSRVFWRNLNIWSYTVKQCFNGTPITFDEAKARKEDKVGHIAYVNLKKKYEEKDVGRTNSDDVDIQRYVDSDWEFIDKQLRLINPDVIFCCGTYKYLASRLQADPLGDGLYRSQGKVVIDFCHPSTRFKSYRSTFEHLCKILKNLPSQSIRMTTAETSEQHQS